MDEGTLDPYEQQLLAVFNSCDGSSEGSLNSEGLTQLCEKLQLGEHSQELISCLLGNTNDDRVSFQEFRDGLLTLLNGGSEVDHCKGDVSPVREVSPKYVCGKKKYGRRSRPESGELENDVDVTLEDSDCDTFLPSSGASGDEANIIKKRKTSFDLTTHENISANTSVNGLETSTSHYGATDNSLDQNSSNSMISVADNEECLRESWISFAGSHDVVLGKDDVRRVCLCLSEDSTTKVLDEVLNKLRLNDGVEVSFNEFLQCWRVVTATASFHTIEESEKESNSLTSLEMSQKGFVSGATLVDQWESAGVPGAAQLLHDLGYSTAHQVNVAALINIMEIELNGFRKEDKLNKNLNVHLALLDANLVLQRLYVACLKSTIEHLTAEREKLKSDIMEANQRAFLLAQEVDDHHSKLEKSSQEQIRLLEQRHCEQMKEITNQLKTEQEQLSMQNTVLEQKVLKLQEDESSHKLLLARLETDHRMLEQEHRNLLEQLAESEVVRNKLEKDLDSLKGLQERLSEVEGREKDREMQLLLDRIRLLDEENTELRDRNDELTMEVEDLTSKLANTSFKKCSSPTASLNLTMLDGLSCAIKRRGGSPNEEESSGDEDSPRLGKVRKCAVKDYDLAASVNLQGLKIHPTAGDLDKTEECLDLNNREALADLNSDEDMDVEDIKTSSSEAVPFSEELKQVLEVRKPCSVADKLKEIRTILAHLKSTDCKCDRCRRVDVGKQVKEVVREHVPGEKEQLLCKIDQLEKELKEATDRHENEKHELTKRCNHLESSVEMLKIEYEKTEDYWSKKLEEERNFFDQEQKVSDDKYTELVNKIMEYEEMLINEKSQESRLETIDERASLESQVADIEEEYAEQKRRWEQKLQDREEQLAHVQKELTRLVNNTKQSTDACTQVFDNVPEQTTSSSSSGLHDKPNSSCDSDVQDRSYSRSFYSKPEPQHKERYSKKSKNRGYYKREGGTRTHFYNPSEQLAHITMLQDEINGLKETKLRFQQDCTLIAKQRDVMYKEMMEFKQQQQRDSTRSRYLAQQCNNYFIAQATGPIGNNPNMTKTVKYLEQKCQNLQKQRKQAEDILERTWTQHKAEVTDLRCVLKTTEDKLKQKTSIIQEQLSKLAHTDVLVKDLFVENAFLLSNIQKLEQVQQQHCYECLREKKQTN